MTKLQNLFLLSLFSLSITSCGNTPTLTTTEQESNESSSQTSEEITTTTEKPGETLVFDQTLAGFKDDAMPFFNLGWSTGNSKFSDNSLRLIEGSDYSTGSGFVRSAAFTAVNDGVVKIKIQSSGFNNNANKENFIGKTFGFTVHGIDNTEDQNIIDSKSYSHVIDETDVANGYFPTMSQFDSTGATSSILEFKLTGGFEKIKITYDDKPSFTLNGKENGVNLELFNISLYSL